MLIAKAWFRILDEISEKGLLEEFKKDVANITLVGEYVGN